MYGQGNCKGNCNQRHEESIWSLYSYGWIVLQEELLETKEIANLNNKKFQILPTCALFAPDDVCNTYVEIDKDLQLNINICNALVAKAHIWFDIGDILCSSFISQFNVFLKDFSYYLNLKCILPERFLVNLVIMWH